MIPSLIIARMASLGLSETQATAVASMLSDVEAATKHEMEKETVRVVSELNAILDARREAASKRTRLYRERGGVEIPGQLRQQVYDRDNFSCVYCGSGDYLQCDHDIPVSKGGETTLENLVTACRVCNARKKDRTRKQFVRGMSADKSGQKRNSSDVQRTERRRSSRLTSDWKPTPEMIDFALGQGLTSREIEAQAEKMRDWSLSATTGKKLDWLATWRGWIRRFLETRTKTNGNHGGVIAALGRLDFGDDDVLPRPRPLSSTSGKGSSPSSYGVLPKG